MAGKATLLLVDDEKSNLKVLAEFLRPDYLIRLAQSGQQALDKCRQQVPDLILMDVLMPGLDGFETLQRLRADMQTCQVPVIFITGLQSAEHEQQGLRLGAQDYIHKPFHAEVVKARVQTQLKLVQQRLELQQLSQQLIQANEAKNRFLATISHEIRTPLTSVIGYAEAMLAGEFAAAEQQQAIRIICQNGKHLQALLNDLLDLSKIAANRLDIELLPVALPALLQEVVQLSADKARQKGLQFQLDFHFPLPSLVLTDPTRLKQILLNLCNNAVKFTSKGQVSLQLTCIEQQLEFRICDTGIGISPAQQQLLFQPFGQADASVQRQFGGTGLGLVIARQLCEKLGGHLQLASSSAQGSCFVATIALQTADGCSWLQQLPPLSLHADEQSPAQLSRQPIRGRVLLAEDQADTRQLLIRMLQHTGLEVVAVENGEQLVETAMRDDFELIFSDIQMPKMDGISAIVLLKAAGVDTPCVALTANTMAHEVQRYLAAGFISHLAKPVDRSQFAALLQQFFPNLPAKPQLQLPAAELAAMTQRFVSTLPQLQQQLQHLMQQQDVAAIRYQSHAIKGTAALFGLTELARQAAAVEQAALLEAQHTDWQQLEQQWQQLTAVMLQLMPPLAVQDNTALC